eukprot:jgi/Phyca11/63084/gw1.27.524.1
MRTAFTFDDDKQLVQLARKYVETNQRIAWADIARRMSSTGHKAAALRQRLQSLYRTWGRDITRFPPNFFTASTPPDRPSCSAESEVPLLSPSMAEQVVASIFADVPRATV